MSYTIQFTRSTSPLDISTTDSAVRLNVTVIAVTGFADFGVFVFGKDVNDDPIYNHAATAYDVRTYAFEDFGSDDYQRRGSLTLDFDSADALEEFYTSMIDRLNTLCYDMNTLATYATTTTVTVIG